ncbi:L-type lectin-domain containing receptor kinase S.6 [Pyrus ussuriensis x Pyrus communis]|uniref:non-specific serine/threonine protein kinase n=1 Tax=Pyrus ussuriensis x Pyrus communis TaxID=2448454 RepID=A0A5N5FKC7_9ROSA|nr:L-type lectin-domain containing receptor kinase S.6 [Pyrus ussuriensis x Pyrus communis]
MHSSRPFLFWVLFFFVSNLSFLSLSVPFLPATNNNLTLFGDASITNTAISLTQELTTCPSSSPSASPGVGRAFYAYPIRFLDSKTNATASFLCRFSFSITPSSRLCSSGDGIAFVITPDVDSLGSSRGGYMGLPEPSSASKESFFAVEFDTRFDPMVGDINGNHIGIDLNTVVSVACVDVVSRGIDLTSGREITAWIEYRDAVKMIRVWVGYSSTRPPTPLLVAQIDLSNQFKEFMRVGFSASNGQGSSVHVVYRWRFKTFGSLPPGNPTDAFEEGDCFMCSSPADSSTKSSPENRSHERKTKIVEMALGLGGLAAFVVSIIAFVFVICFVCVKKRRVTARRSREGKTCRVEANKVPTSLSLAEIRSATMGFNRHRVVGEGASAKVYKGSLSSGGEVAVKRFERGDGISSLRNPFSTEFATMVGCLRHKNLIQLHGWCCEGNELVLVYEYMPNGSLNKVLHKSFNSAVVLSWKQRLNIVLGVASALAYLHEECERQIIHRDVKTCNIMLDADFNAKLGDFGLAEVYEHSSIIAREATIPAGTMGYLAPEYVYSGVPTVKTDVYSFGVVVLEVATGRKPVEDDGTVVVDWVWSMWEKGKLIEAADLTLMGKFDMVEMERMLMTGLACVHPNHVKRPTVKEAARILKGETPLPLLPPRKPRVSLCPVYPDECEEIPLCCGVRPSLEHDDVQYLTPKSHFGKD